jgi:trehalose-6-phosphate synthase
MIKGIPQKLLAYEKFLQEHPEWRDKVLLVQVRRALGFRIQGLGAAGRR